MSEQEIANAVKNALKDEKLLDLFAATVGKKVIEQKSIVKSTEDRLVKDHVVFGKKDEADNYLTAKEIQEKVIEFNPKATISTRMFGKSLLAQAEALKQTNKGRAYNIVAIVEDMKKYAASLPVVGVEVIDEDSAVVGDPAEAFEPPFDLGLLIAAVNEFKDIGEYKSHLESLSRKKLNKHIEKHQLPLKIAKSVDDAEAVDRVVTWVGKQLEEEDKDPPKKEKKGKSKDKNEKVGEIAAEDLAKAGKKDKKKKKKKKKKS